MSLAENLLNNMSSNARLSTEEEPHIVVGEDRVIKVPQELKLIAVKGDKDIETVTIDCVRYWDGFDLSTFSVIINYTLPNGKTATYIPKNLTTYDDYFSFDWTIGQEITQYVGQITFWIVAKSVNSDGELLYQWSSLQNTEMRVAEGGTAIVLPETEEQVDAITQALQLAQQANKKVNNFIKAHTAESWKFTLEDGSIVEKLVLIRTGEFNEEEEEGTKLKFSIYHEDTSTIYEYAVDVGTTWGAWAETTYDESLGNNLYVVDGTKIKYSPNSQYVIDGQGNYVNANDSIIKGYYYTEGSKITFLIDSVGYTADVGMPWNEWVNSVYNTGNFVVESGYRYIAESWNNETDTGVVVGKNGTAVHPDDTIQQDTYTLIEVGKNVETLTFKIEGVEYEFESGMTWSAWLSSQYNTKPYYAFRGYVSPYDGYTGSGSTIIYVCTSDHSAVSLDSAITQNVNYTTYFISGGTTTNNVNFTIDGTSYSVPVGADWAYFYNHGGSSILSIDDAGYLHNIDGNKWLVFSDTYGKCRTNDIISNASYMFNELIESA